VTIALTTVALVWGGIQARRAVTAIAEARVNVETARVDVELTRAVLDQRDADAREQAVRARVDQAEQHEREASLKTRTQLLASLSHELRTPLNAVVGFLDLLARSSLTTPQSSHVECARTSAKHVLALISDVLDASKIESGALELERAAFDVANTVREAARLVESSARDRNVTLEVDVADDLTAPLVGDSLRLRQIVLNLLSNAIKFTRTRVVLRARWSGETDSLSIEVEDDGVGIPEDRIARIFEPYRQADRSTSRRHGGTGLGLSISRQLARLMRGDLVVESRHGSGSTFRFSAPLPRADAADLAVGASEEMAVEVPPLRVLLADDDASNRLVGGQLLGVLGHTVDLAIDGTDALEQALAVQHDLIILDVEMPHLDGTEVARRLRTAGVNVPILGFTGHASSQQRVACLRAGMDGVVEKPADLSRLSKGILDVLLPPGGPHRRENGAEVAKSLASHVGVPTPPIGVSRPEVAEALAARLAANTAPHPKPSAPLRDVGSGLDLDELDQRVGGDAQLFRDVLVAVRDESRRLFCELGQATERRDLEGMRKVAHTLKGCVANVGARPVREAVTAVEVAAKAGEVERALELAGHAIALGDSLAAALAHACEQRAA
jgi:signal transduction histidine kinase/CheY-like chemotaxis protein